MPVLSVDGVTISYEVHGTGPAMLIPRCNFAWSSLDLSAFVDDYTVVIASPRGFGNSERLARGYTVETIRSDLEAVIRHLDFEDYIVLGYSMTGSVAPWMAHNNPRVRAVVSGGFPTPTS
jgi:pimeloyl-ACP methyl ester carboxylesterase